MVPKSCMIRLNELLLHIFVEYLKSSIHLCREGNGVSCKYKETKKTNQTKKTLHKEE